MWGRPGRSRSGIAALAVAAGGLLAAAPAAQGAFGLTPTVTPASTNAGANADLKIDIAITDPQADLKDLTIHLPPGLVGNPLAAEQCTQEQLASAATGGDGCPDASDVGDVSNDVTLTVLGFLPVDQTVTGNVFNMVPGDGEPARFGIVLNALPFNVPILGPALLPPIVLQSAAALRPEDLGLDSILKDLPNTAMAGGMPTAIDINSLSLTLAGTASKGGFIRLPTSCKTHTVGFDATAHDGQSASAQTTFDTTNCSALPFTPEFSARVVQGAIGEGIEVSTTISQTIEEAGLRRAQVTLPKDVTGNTSALATQCADADFQAGNCPANTIVGSATATSPLQSEPLIGTVALVDTPAGNFPDLGIDLRGALALKLKGVIALTDDIRSQVTFDGLPDIPISDFTLSFAGGPRATALNFAVRDLCQPPPLVFDAAFLSHSGATASVSPQATVTCSGAGAGGGGGDGGRKKPKARIKVSGESSDEPTLGLRIRAGSEKLRSAVVKLPKQLGFANGKAFDQGSSVAKVKVTHTKRTLKLKSKKAVKRFAAKFSKGAVKAGKGLSPQSKLIFKLKVRDAGGKTTKLRVRAK